MTNPLEIDRMNGHQFEYYCAELLKRNGYRNVKVTPGSGDNGVDILAERDGFSYAIQCKCYSKKLGNKAAQEAFSGCTYYGCDKAVVLTNSYFTEPAKDAARKTGVILWDRDTLLALDRVAYPSNAAYGSQRTITPNNNGKRVGFTPVLIVVLLIVFYLPRMFGLDSKRTSNEIQTNKGAQTSVETQINSEVQENAPEEWVYPVLDDFEYEFYDKSIILEAYKGIATSIVIPTSYEVEGTILPVKKLNGTFRNVKLVNLIIPDSVTHIDRSTFFVTKTLKHIYIPASLSGSNELLQEFPNGEILYYGGTEEQWHNFCDATPRSKITFKRVIFNAKPEDCLANIDTIINERSDEKNEVEYVPLSDFDYDVYKHEITLLKYNGKEKFVQIAPEYVVNGEKCSVVKLGSALFWRNVDTVIIPEGVTTLSSATFNSSNAKTIYFPASLNDFPKGFWGYLRNVDTIYYGGSEEEFRIKSPIDRWSIDVKHMVYSASPDDIQIK